MLQHSEAELFVKYIGKRFKPQHVVLFFVAIVTVSTKKKHLLKHVDNDIHSKLPLISSMILECSI